MEAEWQELGSIFSSVPSSPDRLTVDGVRAAIDQKTKPPGSLGQVEILAAQLALLQNTLSPSVETARVIVFGADHGITEEGVSAYPATVTPQMMGNFSSGGAAVCVLSNAANIAVEVVDVGVNADLSELENIVNAKVANGTANFIKGPAMTPEQCRHAQDYGRDAVLRALKDGVECVGMGEMGIGNTASASALIALLLKLDAKAVTGRGTGVDNNGLAHKTRVVQQAIDRHHEQNLSAEEILRRVGGFEIAAISGAILEAARHDLAVLVDGFISSAAALVAVQMQPECRRNLFFSHCSQEAGHAVLLSAMQASPMLNLGMRLGEGSATALAYPILRAAAAMLRDMSTFADAGVSQRSD